MKCPVCNVAFNSTSHSPFLGACGHSVCDPCLSSLKKRCPQGCWGESFSSPKPNFLANDLLKEIDQKDNEQTKQQENFDEIMADVKKNKNETPIFSVKSSVPPQPNSVDPKAVLVSNIKEWSLKGLYNWFCTHGTIVSYGFGNKEGTNKGSAFVEYKTEQEAQSAIKAMHGATIGFQGQPISVVLNPVFAIKKECVDPVGKQKVKLKCNAAVTVRNLGNVTEQQLRNVFEQDGQVLKVALLQDFGKFSGTAHVYFATEDSAKKALDRAFTKIPNTHIKMTVEPYEKK